jgi:hypothetical protein
VNRRCRSDPQRFERERDGNTIGRRLVDRGGQLSDPRWITDNHFKHAVVRVDEYDLTDLVRRIRHPEQQLDGIIIGDQLVG